MKQEMTHQNAVAYQRMVKDSVVAEYDYSTELEERCGSPTRLDNNNNPNKPKHDDSSCFFYGQFMSTSRW